MYQAMRLLFVLVMVHITVPSVSSIVLLERMQKRALQTSHEKPKEVKWAETFLDKTKIESTLHIVKLLKYIAKHYLTDCTPMILFDKFTEKNDNLIIEKLLTNFPIAYIHGRISDNYDLMMERVSENPLPTCVTYILFLNDVMKCKNVIGDQSHNRVVVFARSSQWRVLDFLMHEDSRIFVNILVIVQSERIMSNHEEAPYILYTHKLFVDALGSSRPKVLTSFQKGRFTRNVNLFPRKISAGFSGHRFIVAAAHQPPFVVSRERSYEGNKAFEGTEIRLLNVLSRKYNFTTDYREATEDISVGSSEAVTRTVEEGKANLGIGGIYVTSNKLNRVGMSRWHSQDCAAFASLSSTALPRYRAIMGPFHWTVWMALVIIYLFGIFPLSFSEKHTLKHLIKNPEEIENMFWYVYGTFTNCFTFTGEKSWSRADKMTTRLLIVFYWLFTIIVTACYTGSIIAFVTLPVYPALVDTIDQLKSGRYQIGILDKGEWPKLFVNYSDPSTEKLLKNLDLVPNVQSGLKNATTTFFWNYAFMGSQAELDFILRSNITMKNKRSILHVSQQCLVPFNVAIIFPKKSIYGDIINRGIEHIIQSGLLNKIRFDVEWEMMRSSTGKLLAANSRRGSTNTLTYEDRALTLDDTQGMFLLLGAGCLIGAAALTSEWFGGCVKFFTRKRQD